MEQKEKIMQSVLVHENAGRKPVTTAFDQEISCLEQLEKTYPDATAQGNLSEGYSSE